MRREREKHQVWLDLVLHSLLPFSISWVSGHFVCLAERGGGGEKVGNLKLCRAGMPPFSFFMLSFSSFLSSSPTTKKRFGKDKWVRKEERSKKSKSSFFLVSFGHGDTDVTTDFRRLVVKSITGTCHCINFLYCSKSWLYCTIFFGTKAYEKQEGSGVKIAAISFEDAALVYLTRKYYSFIGGGKAKTRKSFLRQSSLLLPLYAPPHRLRQSRGLMNTRKERRKAVKRDEEGDQTGAIKGEECVSVSLSPSPLPRPVCGAIRVGITSTQRTRTFCFLPLTPSRIYAFFSSILDGVTIMIYFVSTTATKLFLDRAARGKDTHTHILLYYYCTTEGCGEGQKTEL